MDSDLDTLYYPFALKFVSDAEQVEDLHLVLQGGLDRGYILAQVGEGQHVILGSVATREFAWRVVQTVRLLGAPPQPDFILAAHRARFLVGEMPTVLDLNLERPALREGPLVVVR